jgi:hypothetical protein
MSADLKSEPRGEVCVVGEDGKRSDAAIHEEILSQGDHKRAREAGRRAGEKIGLSEETLDAIYGPKGD